MQFAPPKFVEGYAFGERYPLTLISFTPFELTGIRRAAVTGGFLEMLIPGKGTAGAGSAGFDASAFPQNQDGSIAWFLALIDHIQKMANLPVFASARIRSQTAQEVRCLIPALPDSMAHLGRMISLLANHLILPDDHQQRPALAAAIQQGFKALCLSGYAQTNPARLLRAAYDAGISFMPLPGKAVQFGIGRKSVVMNSTFTHRTPKIGAEVAKNKLLSAAILRRLGLPVADHSVARSADHAAQIAENMGYPVVIKPADKDGGVGVVPDLRDLAEVKQAFTAASKHSQQVLVEQHIPGKDYRLVVFEGQVVWAVEREPGSVRGDGASSVAQLVELANRNPHRGLGANMPMEPIILDDEAALLLNRAGLSFASVPQKGQFIRLRRAANVASGGTPIAVFDQLHPDNAQLAILAAEACDLDLAGIDLLLPDIAVSWHESGGAICEVNAQPQLGGVTSAHLYPMILKKLVGGDGHIPVCVILGAEQAKAMASELAARIVKDGLRLGHSGPDGVFAGSDKLLGAQAPILQAGHLLASRRDLDAILLGVFDLSIVGTGLPVPKIDVLILSGESLVSDNRFAKTPENGWLSHLFEMLAPSCNRIVITAPLEECAPDLRAALDQINGSFEVVETGLLIDVLVSRAAQSAAPQ